MHASFTLKKLIVNNILFRQAFVSFTIVVPGKNSRRIKPISYFSSLNHFLTKLVSVRLKEGIRHENWALFALIFKIWFDSKLFSYFSEKFIEFSLNRTLTSLVSYHKDFISGTKLTDWAISAHSLFLWQHHMKGFVRHPRSYLKSSSVKGWLYDMN